MTKNLTATEKEELYSRVDEMNAKALAESFNDLRETYDTRLAALENEIITLKVLVQKQSQVIGQAMASVMGTGSTEPE